MRVLVKRILILLIALSTVFGFSVRVVPTASAEDAVIHKILTTVTPTPVALLDPATITAATSTPGLSITSAGWFDASGNAVKSAFNPETYKIEIHVKADDGYVIASDVAAYLNNSTVKIDVENSGKTATIYREYTAAIWAPTIIKNPSAETVKEGGWASFAVSASYARDYEWFLEGPDGRQAVSVSDIHLTYPEMSATGNGSTKMNLYHIPYELNGWRVVCNFIGAGTNNSVKSQGALLTVIPTTPREATGTAADTAAGAGANAPDGTADVPAVDPADADAGTVDAVSEEAPADSTAAATENGNSAGTGSDSAPVEASPESSEQVYSDAWSSDALGHWHDSVSGESRAQEARHSFVWYDGEDGTKTGVCDICGYTMTRRPAESGSSSSENSEPASAAPTRESSVKPDAVMVLLMALAPVDAALVATHAVRSSKKTKKNNSV